MELSGNFTELFCNISPRGMLQKILVALLATFQPLSGIVDKRFPLSYLSSSEGVTYNSAIAPMLCANQSQDAVRWAEQFAIFLRSSLRDNTILAEKGRRAIANHLQIETNDRGWLKLTLAESGIAAWLDSLQSLNISVLVEVLTKCQLPTTSLKRQSFPLGDRLRLSLPMLLNWAYTRCHLLLEAAELRPNADCSEQFPASHQDLPTWTNDSPPLCHELLKATVQVVDHLAAQPITAQNFMKQGYALAETIYTFDAALPTLAVSKQRLDIQVATYSMLRAVKNILALILIGLFGETPSLSF